MPKKNKSRATDFIVEDLDTDPPDGKRFRPWHSGQELPVVEHADNLAKDSAAAGSVPTGSGTPVPVEHTTTSMITDNSPGKLVPFHYDTTVAKADIIPVFDPEKSDTSSHQWLAKIEQLAAVHNWSDAIKSYYMQARLGGIARVWHSSLNDYNKTWSDWKYEFLSAFPHNIDFADRLREMLNKRKNINDTMAQYYYQKNAMLHRLNLTGEEAVSCLIDGLPAHLKAPARAGNFNSPADLYSRFLAMMEEKFRPLPPGRMRIQPKESVGPLSDIQNTFGQTKDLHRTDITCYLCGEVGHVVRRCPKKPNRPACTICGKTGHTMDKCWSKPSTSNSKPPTTISLISAEVNETYFMNVIIDGKCVRVYFDSGAKINVASISFSKRLQSPLLPCDYMLKGFTGNAILANGLHKVIIEINNIKFNTELVVADWKMQQYPLVILGQPIINDPRIKFIISGNSLEIKEVKDCMASEILLIGEVYPISNQRNLFCIDDVVIPSTSVTNIKVACPDLTEDESILVEASLRRYDLNDFSFPSTILSRDTNYLLIRNDSTKPLTFKKGQLVARGICCEEVETIQSNSYKNTTLERDMYVINIEEIQCDAKDMRKREELVSLLQDYAECFSTDTAELGCTDKIKMRIDLNSEKPICYRPYRLSEFEKSIVRDKIKDLIENKIIQESNSPYSSPIVLVKKNNGDYRLCVDYRKLNSITVKDRYPMPIIEEQVEKLNGKCVFTSLDMSQGFYQIPLEEESIPKTGFSTPEGHYEFLRMPFGLANSPSVYQRLIDRILGTLRYEKALPYMDDLLIASASEDEALSTLKEVLDIVRDSKLTLNLSKCKFLQSKIQYLGYEICEEGIRPGTKKIEAVTKFKEPENIHELRMFLGLTSYFRKFVRGYAVIAHDLYKLLKKGEPWLWDTAHNEAFNKLKDILTTRPVLTLYDPKASIEVHTDASSKGVAGILLQDDGSGLKPVAYFSRKTSREESIYHSYELESLAVVESLKRFRVYLVGVEFKVVTDCAAVRQTFEKRDLLPRIARWWLSIQEYSFTVIHRPGTTHKHVDALSRSPVDESDHIESHSMMVLDLLDWVVCMQYQDPRLNIIKEKLESNDNDPEIKNNYKLKDNKIYRKCLNDELRVVIPKYCKWNILRKYHDDIGHPGLKKCDKLIKENCWFPGMTRFIRKYVNGCLDCAYKRGQYGKHEGELHPIDKGTEPMNTLHIDHAGPFCKSRKGGSYLFVVVDSFTKFVWAKACKTTKSAEVIEKLNEIFSAFGYPKRIISDSGAAFTSKSFKEFCVQNQIKHVKNAIACPRSNGQVERYNRTLIEAINKSTTDEKDWDTCLNKVVWGINNTVHATTGFTPYRLMFQASRSLLQGLENNSVDDEDTAQNNVEIVRENIRKKAIDMKKRFDAKRNRPTIYKIKDLVLWRKSESGNKDVRRKLKEKYSGPYKVVKCLGNDRYIITSLKGMKGYKKFTATVASDALRKFVELVESDTESNDTGVDSTEELIDLLEG